MNRLRNTLSWLTAVASFAMLLGVQTLHDPLQHQCSHGCCQHAPAAAPAKSACGHHHHHAAHASTESGQRLVCSKPASERRSGSDDSHDCQLCQLLTLALQPPALPVQLVSIPVVEQPVADHAPLLPPAPRLLSLARGPPALSSLWEALPAGADIALCGLSPLVRDAAANAV
jgi:hypothetical protein